MPNRNIDQDLILEISAYSADAEETRILDDL